MEPESTLSATPSPVADAKYDPANELRGELVREITAISQQLDEKRTLLTQVQAAVNATLTRKTDLDTTIHALEAKVNTLQRYIDGYKENIEQKTKHLADASQAITDSNETIAALTKEEHATRAQINALKGDYAKKRADHAAELEKEIAPRKAEYETLTTAVTALTKEKAAREAVLKQLSHETAVLTSEIATLEANRDTLNNEEKAITKALTKATKDLSVVNANITTANQTLQQIEAFIAAAKAESADLRALTDTLRKEIEELKNQASAAKTEYDSQRVKLFNISSREKALISKESYIKQLYREANVAFPPQPEPEEPNQ